MALASTPSPPVLVLSATTISSLGVLAGVATGTAAMWATAGESRDASDVVQNAALSGAATGLMASAAFHTYNVYTHVIGEDGIFDGIHLLVGTVLYGPVIGAAGGLLGSLVGGRTSSSVGED